MDRFRTDNGNGAAAESPPDALRGRYPPNVMHHGSPDSFGSPGSIDLSLPLLTPGGPGSPGYNDAGMTGEDAYTEINVTMEKLSSIIYYLLRKFYNGELLHFSKALENLERIITNFQKTYNDGEEHYAQSDERLKLHQEEQETGISSGYRKMTSWEFKHSLEIHRMEREKLNALNEKISAAKIKRGQLFGEMNRMKTEIKENERKLREVAIYLNRKKPKEQQRKTCLPCISKPPSYVVASVDSVDGPSTDTIVRYIDDVINFLKRLEKQEYAMYENIKFEKADAISSFEQLQTDIEAKMEEESRIRRQGGWLHYIYREKGAELTGEEQASIEKDKYKHRDYVFQIEMLQKEMREIDDILRQNATMTVINESILEYIKQFVRMPIRYDSEESGNKCCGGSKTKKRVRRLQSKSKNKSRRRNKSRHKNKLRGNKLRRNKSFKN